MSTKIICKQVSNLTRDEYRACSRLTMGYVGLLKEQIDYEYQEKTNSKVLMLIEAESKRLLAWGLLDNENTLMVYVKKSHRRKRLGHRIMRKASKLKEQIKVCPWDQTSRDFYSVCLKQFESFQVDTGYHL